MPSNPSTISVFGGFRLPGHFVWSPFVTKLEARLRFSGLPYKVAGGSPAQGPKGKIPYVEIQRDEVSDTPEKLSDSSLIVTALCEAGILKDLNARLSPAERAHDLALRALLEDKLFFYGAWERWVINFYTMRDHVMAALPWYKRLLFGALMYRRMVAMLYGQGTGRHTAAEIGAFRREIWASFADLASVSRSAADAETEEKHPFWLLGGPEPTDSDATLFGFICSALLCTAGPESQADLKSFPVLLEYAHRIQERYFPDYQALPL